MFEIIMNYIHELMLQLHDPWKVFGILAQTFFMMRFGVQWIMSEKTGTSVIPISFWYFSILGAISLLVYGVQQKEIVIILGQSFPLIIYIRNLILIHRNKKTQSPKKFGITSTQSKHNSKNDLVFQNSKILEEI